ncbi:unnamed protein product [Trichogramma brassicae]|uniref:C2H2-type domain-containing protein n=1 Tax=Trichogramma brassicae TaxID=86971 RepID=A0A6H5I7N1_9HYME|nr:unnamed protein product [Trichogramma brassicae]
MRCSNGCSLSSSKLQRYTHVHENLQCKLDGEQRQQQQQQRRRRRRRRRTYTHTYMCSAHIGGWTHKFSFEDRSILLDDIEFDSRYAVTGVKLTHYQGLLRLDAQGHRFDYKLGRLTPDSSWYSFDGGIGDLSSRGGTLPCMYCVAYAPVRRRVSRLYFLLAAAATLLTTTPYIYLYIKNRGISKNFFALCTSPRRSIRFIARVIRSRHRPGSSTKKNCCLTRRFVARCKTTNRCKYNSKWANISAFANELYVMYVIRCICAFTIHAFLGELGKFRLTLGESSGPRRYTSILHTTTCFRSVITYIRIESGTYPSRSAVQHTFNYTTSALEKLNIVPSSGEISASTDAPNSPRLAAAPTCATIEIYGDCGVLYLYTYGSSTLVLSRSGAPRRRRLRRLRLGRRQCGWRLVALYTAAAATMDAPRRAEWNINFPPHVRAANEKKKKKEKEALEERRRSELALGCEKTFVKKLSLSTHQKLVHKDRDNFKSDNCEKKFGQKKHLIRHQKTIHEGRKDYARSSVSTNLRRSKIAVESGTRNISEAQSVDESKRRKAPHGSYTQVYTSDQALVI